jgi:hypothetical protein
MCSVPVTLGGGSWIENEGFDGSRVGACSTAAAQTGPQRDSMAAGSKDLASSVMVGGTAGHGAEGTVRPRGQITGTLIVGVAFLVAGGQRGE